MAKKISGLQLIAQEREKQIEKWGLSGDAKYTDQQLIDAAVTCLVGTTESLQRPQWAVKLTEKYPKAKDQVKLLQIAGALIAAEIDRRLAVEGNPFES